MRTILLLALATLLAPIQVPAQTADKDPIYQQELKVRKAIHAHDMATLESLLAPGFVEVEDTISTRDQILGFMKSCTVNNYTIHSHQVRMLTPDIAIIIYPVKMDITCGKDHESGEFNDTTTWARTPNTGKGPGKWLAQLHTNAVAAKP